MYFKVDQGKGFILRHSSKDGHFPDILYINFHNQLGENQTNKLKNYNKHSLIFLNYFSISKLCTP